MLVHSVFLSLAVLCQTSGEQKHHACYCLAHYHGSSIYNVDSKLIPWKPFGGINWQYMNENFQLSKEIDGLLFWTTYGNPPAPPAPTLRNVPAYSEKSWLTLPFPFPST